MIGSATRQNFPQRIHRLGANAAQKAGNANPAELQEKIVKAKELLGRQMEVLNAHPSGQLVVESSDGKRHLHTFRLIDPETGKVINSLSAKFQIDKVPNTMAEIEIYSRVGTPVTLTIHDDFKDTIPAGAKLYVEDNGQRFEIPLS